MFGRATIRLGIGPHSSCICFYDIALWKNVKASILSKLKSAYIMCMKMFFGYKKYNSVTDMLFTTRPSSFDTVLHNACHTDYSQWCVCNNALPE